MFFAFVVLTMAAIVSAVLFLTGTLSLRDSGGRLVFDNELRHLAASTERRMGHLSAMAIRMGHHLCGFRTSVFCGWRASERRSAYWNGVLSASVVGRRQALFAC